MGGSSGGGVTVSPVQQTVVDPSGAIQTFKNADSYLTPILQEAATKLQASINSANAQNAPFTTDSLNAIAKMRQLSGMAPTTQSEKLAAEKLKELIGNTRSNTGTTSKLQNVSKYADSGYTPGQVYQAVARKQTFIDPFYREYAARMADGSLNLRDPRHAEMARMFSGGPISLDSLLANPRVSTFFPNIFTDADAAARANAVISGQGVGVGYGVADPSGNQDRNEANMAAFRDAWGSTVEKMKGTSGQIGLTGANSAVLDDFQRQFDGLQSIQDNATRNAALSDLQSKWNNYKASVQYDMDAYQAASRGETLAPARAAGLNYVGTTGLRFDPNNVLGGGPDVAAAKRAALAGKLGTMSDSEVVKYFTSPGADGKYNLPGYSTGRFGGVGPASLTQAQVLADPTRLKLLADVARQNFGRGLTDPNNGYYTPYKPYLNDAAASDIKAQLFAPIDGTYGKQALARAAQTQGVDSVLAGYRADLQNLDSGVNSIISSLPASIAEPMNAQQLQDYLISRPGFGTQYTTGQQTLQRAQAASGKLGSGQGLLEAQNYSQDAVQTAYQQEMNRLAAVAGLGIPFVNAQTQASTNQALAARNAAIQAPLLNLDTGLKVANTLFDTKMFNASNKQQTDTTDLNNQTSVGTIALGSGQSPGSKYKPYSPPSSSSGYFSGMF